MKITRPLLASSAKDLTDLRYPVLASEKLDGIRCLKIDGEVVSRNFKPIPNDYVRERLKEVLPDGIDGEIMLKSVETVQTEINTPFTEMPPVLDTEVPRKVPDFNAIQSAVMSFDGTPNFMYCAFDLVTDDLNKPYEDRMKELGWWYDTSGKDTGIIEAILPKLINTVEELEEFEAQCIAEGYEGVMIRDPKGMYKCGRSTLNQGILLKLKRFKDAEGEVIGFEERMHNSNEQEKDKFGLAKRSSKKSGKVGAGTLGSLLVKDLKSGLEFGLGTGFDDEQRKDIWNNKDKYLGKLVTYKFQELSKDGIPRFPVFKGVRSHLDI